MPRFTIRGLLILTLAAAGAFATVRIWPALGGAAISCLVGYLFDRVSPSRGMGRAAMHALAVICSIISSIAFAGHLGQTLLAEPSDSFPVAAQVVAGVLMFAVGFSLRALRGYSPFDFLAAVVLWMLAMAGLFVVLGGVFPSPQEFVQGLAIGIVMSGYLLMFASPYFAGVLFGDVCVRIAARR